MTLSNSLLTGVGVAAAISLIAATNRIDSLRSDNATIRRDLQTQTQARNTAEWLLQNQQQVNQVFSTIRAANRAARLNDESKHNEAKQIITAATAQDDCGDRLVPAAAADELHRLEDYARTAGDHLRGDRCRTDRIDASTRKAVAFYVPRSAALERGPATGARPVQPGQGCNPASGKPEEGNL